MKILCTGDLHIGRRPSRIRATSDDPSLSCASRWSDIVECALAQQADVVALSGDVIDRDNKHFEAIGPLERGVKCLVDHGIAVVAVTGNHDFDVLPHVARTLGPERFQVIGLGGHWEARTISTRCGELLHVHGWSFPQEHVHDDPLGTYALSPASGAVTLGLVHGELDTPTSRYAPLSLARLRECGTSFWLLGHLHAPRLLSRAHGSPVLYPGSPQALDPGPGERGPHGVWIADVVVGAPPAFRFIALSTVRYDEVEVNVTGMQDETVIRDAVITRIRDASQAMCADAQGLRVISLRVRIVGRTTLHQQAERLFDGLVSEFEWPTGDVTTYIERVDVETRPAYDLDQLATGHDAPAVLARLLRQLDTGETDEHTKVLLRDLTLAAREIRAAKAYRGIAADIGDVDEVALRDLAALEASRLLDALVDQQQPVS